MHLSTLDEWLSWIATVHSTEIELGLDRIKIVAARLNILEPHCPVIIVGGTNGKGSTVAGIEAIYRAAGYQVGAFTSPILLKHNEQVRINGKDASDAEFCDAFAKVEAARGDILLTPFEFQTLAALIIFHHHPLHVLILEVGLGGRLDAVNIIDADISVVTSIAIDHVEWLGSTREMIGREKAGIFRPKKPAVCGDNDPPQSLVEFAQSIGSEFICQGKDFYYKVQDGTWSWSSQPASYEELPKTTYALQNMSMVLMVITLLQQRLPVTRQAIDKGLSNIKLRGRVEVINEPVIKILDVSHNPAAVAMLAGRLNEMPSIGKTFAVFSMLADKDIIESINVIRDEIDDWFIAPLSVKRAASKEMLMNAFQQAGIQRVTVLSSINDAYQLACSKAERGGRIVVFGSFHTVADVLPK